MSVPRCTAPVRGHGNNPRSIERCPVHGSAARVASARRPLSESAARKADLGERLDLSESNDTPAETLRALSIDPHVAVRQQVAWNESTPGDVLAALASAEDHVSVRNALADNKSTPPEVLSLLATDENRDVRRGVAKNPSTPPEVLVLLAGDEHHVVRRGVTRNHNLPTHTLLLLTDDDAILVREYAAGVVASRIAAALGVNASNTGAIDMLRAQAWWEMTPADSAVVVALALSPNA